jgi:predicted Rdx family selenoprotein
MNATDQQKLVKAGFTIIRTELAPGSGDNHRIKTKGSGSHEWKTLEKGFPTKAALERRVNELLKDPIIVQD